MGDARRIYVNGLGLLARSTRRGKTVHILREFPEVQRKSAAAVGTREAFPRIRIGTLTALLALAPRESRQYQVFSAALKLRRAGKKRLKLDWDKPSIPTSCSTSLGSPPARGSAITGTGAAVTF